jgi:hypothetical protein
MCANQGGGTAENLYADRKTHGIPLKLPPTKAQSNTDVSSRQSQKDPIDRNKPNEPAVLPREVLSVRSKAGKELLEKEQKADLHNKRATQTSQAIDNSLLTQKKTQQYQQAIREQQV